MGTSYDGALYAKYKNDCNLFIETGAYIGDGIFGALTVGFEKIISIELAKCQYDFCQNRFDGNEKVKLILGDTRKLLPEILENNIPDNKKIFFWLDAHCSGGTTEGDSMDITLPQELDIILHFIMFNGIFAILAIDDATPTMQEKIRKMVIDYPSEILGIEPCVNPYSNLVETDREIIIIEINGIK